LSEFSHALFAVALAGFGFAIFNQMNVSKHMLKSLLTQATRQASTGQRGLLIIAVFVVVFLEIHPFQDGNGRLSRILTTLLLMKLGYAYVPYSSMESVIEQNKDRYYQALRKPQGTIRTESPDWQPWVMFFLQSLQNQKQRLEKKVEQEWIVMAKLPELSEQILAWIKDHGRASVSELSTATGGN
jgi:Fic family protein